MDIEYIQWLYLSDANYKLQVNAGNERLSLGNIHFSEMFCSYRRAGSQRPTAPRVEVDPVFISQYYLALESKVLEILAEFLPQQMKNLSKSALLSFTYFSFPSGLWGNASSPKNERGD